MERYSDRAIEIILTREAAEKALEEATGMDELFENRMVAKIDSGEELTEDELKGILKYTIEDIVGRYKSIASIVKLCGRTFLLFWTRSGRSQTFNQPFEVVEDLKIKKWKPI